MKIVKMQDSSLKDRYSGVYKITFPNKKCYIGISNNMYRRMIEHNTDMRKDLPIVHAIQKYGKITEFEILEIIDSSNRELMREREKYWISHFDSSNKEKGYNISEGGDGADSGANNHEAKFTEEEIQVLYSELRDNLNLSLADIAKKYSISASTLSRINNGVTYYHSSVSYPVRNPTQCKVIVAGTNNTNASITKKEELERIQQALIEETSISMAQIAKRFNISQTVIQNINNGKTYHNNNLTYPLRKSLTGARKLTNEQVLEIIDYIKKNPKQSFNTMSIIFSVPSKTISDINLGRTYRQETESYPIRSKKH